MRFDFGALDAAQRYKLLSATVVPRPIAWVSSIGADGLRNLAPFSTFNFFGEAPPIVGFSILHRSADDPKDTGANVRATGEFVINLVGDATLDAMATTAIDFPGTVDEFAAAGLTPAASERVAAPRVAESPVSFECRLERILELGPSRWLVLGEVLLMHVADSAVVDAGRAWIDTAALRPVGRLGPNRYVRATDTVERTVPTPDAWRAGR